MDYLGHTAEYWLELQNKARTLDAVDLIKEIAELRGKVSFYENRIKLLNEFMIKSNANT